MALLPGTTDFAADLLLRFYREPTRYRAQMVHAARLLGGPELILKLAVGRPVEFSDPAPHRPDIDVELRRAAMFFVRHVHFRDGATHYQVLGLAPGADADALRRSYRLLMQLTHPDRNDALTAWPELFAARVNRAYAVLRHPDTRAAYDRRLAASAHAEAGGAGAASWAKPVARHRLRHPRLPLRILPDWVTARIGGFMWSHPAAFVLGVLIFASIFVMGLVAWSEFDGALARGDPSPRPAAVAAQ